MQKIFSFVGSSNSGKTTLISKIISELKNRNYSVGAVKYCLGGFDVDREGKDSYRFRENGADPVLLVSKESCVLFKNIDKEDYIILIKEYFRNEDFVIVEGGKTWKGIKKIVVLGEKEKRLQLDSNPIAIVSDIPFGTDVSHFKSDEIKKIVNFMEKENG